MILRSGCYVTHDHGLYSRIAPSARKAPGVPVLEPALEAWAPVLSRPEPGTAVLGIGRRDVSFDAGIPWSCAGGRPAERPSTPAARWSGGSSISTRCCPFPPVPGSPPATELCLGISHPCTTFDKWRWIPVLDAEDRITDVIRTFF